MKRILITGSRDWAEEETIQWAIWNWVHENVMQEEQVILVHGDASRGADRMARDYARKQWWIIEEPHPADWSWGKGAGMDRNKYMVAMGADVCLAFIRNESPGASHCAREAAKAGIPVIRHLDNDPEEDLD